MTALCVPRVEFGSVGADFVGSADLILHRGCTGELVRQSSEPLWRGLSPTSERSNGRTPSGYCIGYLGRLSAPFLTTCVTLPNGNVHSCWKCGMELHNDEVTLRSGLCGQCLHNSGAMRCQICRTTLHVDQVNWRKGVCEGCFSFCEKHCKLCEAALHIEQLRWGSGLCDPCYDNVEKTCKVCKQRLEFEELHWRTGLCNLCYNHCEKTCRLCQSKISLGQLHWRSGYCNTCYDECRRPSQTCLASGAIPLEHPGTDHGEICDSSAENIVCKMCQNDIPAEQARWGSGLCDTCYNTCEKNCRNCESCLALGQLHWGSGLCDTCYNSFGKTCRTCQSAINLGQLHWGTGICDECYDKMEKTCYICRSSLKIGESHWGLGLCNACHKVVAPGKQYKDTRSLSFDSYFAKELPLSSRGRWRLISTTHLDKAFALERAAAASIPSAAPTKASRAMIALWCLFGISGWWAPNSIAAELPLLVTALPERADLGNLIAFSTQLGSICPILYKIAEGFLEMQVSNTIQLAQGVAVVSLICCALFWNELIHNSSIPLLVFTAFAGGVGNMTDVTYWSYAMRHPASCTKPMSVGMSISGLLATGLAALQMGGRLPLFGGRFFFLMAAAMQCVWWSTTFCIDGCSIEVYNMLWGRLSRGCCTCYGKDSTNGGIVSAGAVSHDHGNLVEPLLARPIEPNARRGYSRRNRENNAKAQHSTEKPLLQLAKRLSKLRGPRQQEALPAAMPKILLCACFVAYALTYSTPSLLPFIATAYDGKQNTSVSAYDREQESSSVFSFLVASSCWRSSSFRASVFVIGQWPQSLCLQWAFVVRWVLCLRISLLFSQSTFWVFSSRRRTSSWKQRARHVCFEVTR